MGKTAANSLIVAGGINCSTGRRWRMGCVFLGGIGLACNYYCTQVLFSA